jgi:hypothetical protein
MLEILDRKAISAQWETLALLGLLVLRVLDYKLPTRMHLMKILFPNTQQVQRDLPI